MVVPRKWNAVSPDSVAECLLVGKVVRLPVPRWQSHDFRYSSYGASIAAEVERGQSALLAKNV